MLLFSPRHSSDKFGSALGLSKTLVLITLLLTMSTSAAAQALTLEECRRLARENYPAIAEYELIDRLAEYDISNAKRQWLPQVSVELQASYQSDVTAFPENFTKLLAPFGVKFDGLPKGQYKAAVQVDQIIWDGGAIRAGVDAAQAEAQAARSQWEATMHALRERVDQLFFGTLLLQENLRGVDMLLDDLQRTRAMLLASAECGAIGQDDLDLIDVEILTVCQQRADLDATRRGYLHMLGIMTGTEMADSTMLVKPEATTVSARNAEARPEIAMLDARASALDARRRSVQASLMPRIGAFAQGAYGNTGLNLFEDMQHNAWRPYFIAGIKLQWNIGSFYTRRNRLSQISADAGRLSVQRETFLYNTALQSEQERLAIEKMDEAMRYDEEIIVLRRSIRERTETRLRNGDASVNDLLRDLNAEDRARQNRTVHEVEWLKNIYELKHILNE